MGDIRNRDTPKEKIPCANWIEWADRLVNTSLKKVEHISDIPQPTIDTLENLVDQFPSIEQFEQEEVGQALEAIKMIIRHFSRLGVGGDSIRTQMPNLMKKLFGLAKQLEQAKSTTENPHKTVNGIAEKTRQDVENEVRAYLDEMRSLDNKY